MTPDKYIRKEIIGRITAEAGIFATDKVVPVSVSTPKLFATIGTQTRKRTAVSKQNYEWMGGVTITIVHVNEKGYISSEEADDADSKITAIMDTLKVPGFVTKYTRFFDSISDKIETPDSTLNRKHLTYEIWVNRIS